MNESNHMQCHSFSQFIDQWNKHPVAMILKYLKIQYLNSTETSINLIYIVLIYVYVRVRFGVGFVDMLVYAMLK